MDPDDFIRDFLHLADIRCFRQFLSEIADLIPSTLSAGNLIFSRNSSHWVIPPRRAVYL